jgi:hypothetical protein
MCFFVSPATSNTCLAGFDKKGLLDWLDNVLDGDHKNLLDRGPTEYLEATRNQPRSEKQNWLFTSRYNKRS